MVELTEGLGNQPGVANEHLAIVIQNLQKDMCQYNSGKALLCDLFIYNNSYRYVKSQIISATEKAILAPLEDLSTTNTLPIKPLALIQRLVDLKAEGKTLTSSYLKSVEAYFKEDARFLTMPTDRLLLKMVGFFVLDSEDIYSRSTQTWFQEKEAMLHSSFVE